MNGQQMTTNDSNEPIKLIVNGEEVTVLSSPDTPLLWVLRDELGLTAAKYGCGVAMCGACTVHLDGHALRSCTRAVCDVKGRVTTIEGAAGEDELGIIQGVWIKHNVAQCGYCQPGQIMSAWALLKAVGNPCDKQIDAAMSGNLCRCGTYQKIRAAIHECARRLGSAAEEPEECERQGASHE